MVVDFAVKLSDAQYESFKAGNLYVNVYSAEHKSGEIRTHLAINRIRAERGVQCLLRACT